MKFKEVYTHTHQIHLDVTTVFNMYRSVCFVYLATLSAAQTVPNEELEIV
jgi:hypothetical protein